MLEGIPGRGPGSGVRADEKAIAPLLISLLSHDILAQAYVAELFCGMKSDAGKCPLTGAKTFCDALATILGDERIAEKISWVMVHRNPPGDAYIQSVDLGKNSKIVTSKFKYGAILSSFIPASALKTTTSFESSFLRKIAKDIAQFKKDGAS
jgi:hypothetical protein